MTDRVRLLNHAVPLPHGRDAVVAVGLGAVALAGTALSARLQPDNGFGMGAALACALAAGAWSWHRVAPTASSVAVGTVMTGYLLAGGPYGPIQLVLVLSCFGVARRRGARVAMVVCGVAALVLAAALWTRLGSSPLMATVAVLLAWPGIFAVVPALAGALIRVRAEAADREREELLARGAYEERLRVAREVHDIAGHGFAVVAMQAGVALTVLEESPDQARASLEAIRASSEHGLRELRSTVDGLRVEAPDAPSVSGLVQRVRAGGQPVELSVTGDGRILDPGVGKVLYRVVQEALTNVVRHAGTTTAAVSIEYGTQGISVSIRDRGTGSTTRRPHDTGASVQHGLRGIRDRVEHLGGTLIARDRDAGGFEVMATIPCTGTSR